MFNSIFNRRPGKLKIPKLNNIFIVYLARTNIRMWETVFIVMFSKFNSLISRKITNITRRDETVKGIRFKVTYSERERAVAQYREKD